VTGGSSGIGRAIALEMACAGAEVLIQCRQNTAGADAVIEEIRRGGGRAERLVADFEDQGAVAGFAEAAWKRHGGLEIWINNAGVDLLTGEERRLSYEEKLRRLLEVDVGASLMLSRWIGERMRAQGSGVILNIGWDQADRGMEGESGELFAAAKNAVMGFTRSLAVSLAPEVRVNCIAPGWIKTAWGEAAPDVWHERVLRETPLGRWGTPQDVAALARFLVSDEAGYITGQVINANGGAVR
jgi:3-oxoacyl-[acyl-carrier protein] reductase